MSISWYCLDFNFSDSFSWMLFSSVQLPTKVTPADFALKIKSILTEGVHVSVSWNQINLGLSSFLSLEYVGVVSLNCYPIMSTCVIWLDINVEVKILMKNPSPPLRLFSETHFKKWKSCTIIWQTLKVILTVWNKERNRSHTLLSQPYHHAWEGNTKLSGSKS